MSTTYAYIGTYSDDRDESLFICRYDPANGAMEEIGVVLGLKNPTFLALHPSGETLYAINEVGFFDGKKGGAVSAFRIDRASGQLTPLNTQSTVGPGPCHVAVSPDGACVGIANYGGGSAASYAVQTDGSLSEAVSFHQHEGSSVNEKRQAGPHAHSVTFSPDGCYAYVADLGLDKLMTYRVDGGKLTPANPPFAQTHSGAGPRHMAFHPGKPIAYVINELDATMNVFAYEAATGALSAVQTVPTLPKDYRDPKSCADIHVSPDGRYVYGSNRGHDSIAIFEVDGANGRLTPTGHVPTLGEVPRNFALDPAGKFLVVANQNSGSIIPFKIDEATGRPGPTGGRLEIPKPVCVKFLVVE